MNDCLQLPDKAQLLLDEEQAIVADNWTRIAKRAKRIVQMLEATAKLEL